MAESAQGVALELTKIILARGGTNAAERSDYAEENVLRVYKAALEAASGPKAAFG